MNSKYIRNLYNKSLKQCLGDEELAIKLTGNQLLNDPHSLQDLSYEELSYANTILINYKNLIDHNPYKQNLIELKRIQIENIIIMQLLKTHYTQELNS